MTYRTCLLVLILILALVGCGQQDAPAARQATDAAKPAADAHVPPPPLPIPSGWPFDVFRGAAAAGTAPPT